MPSLVGADGQDLSQAPGASWKYLGSVIDAQQIRCTLPDFAEVRTCRGDDLIPVRTGLSVPPPSDAPPRPRPRQHGHPSTAEPDLIRNAVNEADLEPHRLGRHEGRGRARNPPGPWRSQDRVLGCDGSSPHRSQSTCCAGSLPPLGPRNQQVVHPCDGLHFHQGALRFLESSWHPPRAPSGAPTPDRSAGSRMRAASPPLIPAETPSIHALSCHLMRSARVRSLNGSANCAMPATAWTCRLRPRP